MGARRFDLKVGIGESIYWCIQILANLKFIISIPNMPKSTKSGKIKTRPILIVIIILILAAAALLVYTSAPNVYSFNYYPGCVGNNTTISCTIGQRVGDLFIIKSINTNNTITVWQRNVNTFDLQNPVTISTMTIATGQIAFSCYGGFTIENYTTSDLWLTSISDNSAVFQVISNTTEKCLPP
jgi:uncharacterized membrane protein